VCGIHSYPSDFGAPVDFAPCMRCLVMAVRCAAAEQVSAYIAGGQLEATACGQHNVGKVLAYAASKSHYYRAGAVNIGDSGFIYEGVVDFPADRFAKGKGRHIRGEGRGKVADGGIEIDKSAFGGEGP